MNVKTFYVNVLYHQSNFIYMECMYSGSYV